MDPCLHASLKEKASNIDVYLPESHTSTNSKAQSEPRTPVLTPEFSLTSEDGQVLGIDVHTGLPKLAVELLPEMEEVRPMGPQISTRNETTTNQNKRERKSVSFDPKSDVKRQRSMSDSKVSPSSFCHHREGWAQCGMVCTCVRKCVLMCGQRLVMGWDGSCQRWHVI